MTDTEVFIMIVILGGLIAHRIMRREIRKWVKPGRRK